MTISDRSLRVCYVFLTPIPSGKADFACLVPIRMADVLNDNAELHVLYSGYINKEKLERHGVQAHEYGKSVTRSTLLRMLSVIYSVYFLAKRHKISIFINTWAHYWLFPVSIGARMGGSKVIARIAGVPIGDDCSGLGFWRRIRRKIGLVMERQSLRQADHVHLLSEHLRSVFLKRGVQASKMTVISQGVDTEKFQPRDKSKKITTNNVLYVGRLVTSKGVEHIIRAFPSVARNFANSRLLIAGDGPERVRLQRLSAGLNIESSVDFLGLVSHDDLPSIYQMSTMLILPSQSEGLSNVVLEAQACGLPVIGTNTGEVSVQLGGGRGVILSSQSHRDLAAAIMRLLEDEDLRTEMGSRARSYVREKHSLANVKLEYLNMFKLVLADKANWVE